MILVSCLANAAKVMMLTMVTRMLVLLDAGADHNDVNSLREQFQQFHVFYYINIYM